MNKTGIFFSQGEHSLLSPPPFIGRGEMGRSRIPRKKEKGGEITEDTLGLPGCCGR